MNTTFMAMQNKATPTTTSTSTTLELGSQESEVSSASVKVSGHASLQCGPWQVSLKCHCVLEFAYHAPMASRMVWASEEVEFGLKVDHRLERMVCLWLWCYYRQSICSWWLGHAHAVAGTWTWESMIMRSVPPTSISINLNQSTLFEILQYFQ